MCLTDPGFGVNVMVVADLVAFFKVSAESLSYQEAIQQVRLMKFNGCAQSRHKALELEHAFV